MQTQDYKEDSIPDITMLPDITLGQNHAPAQTSAKTSAQTSETISYNQLMTKLEEEGMKKVQDLHKSNGTSNDLVNIMSGGFDEFKKTTGRNMTYSEMRSLYG